MFLACAERPEPPALPVPSAGEPRAVIFFWGDGMGIATMTAARICAAGEDGELTMDALPETGFVRAHSNDAMVTDSAPQRRILRKWGGASSTTD